MGKLKKKKRDDYVKRLNEIYSKNLKNENIEEIKGKGSIIDKHTVEVDGKRYTTERILIATGGYPLQLEFEGKENLIDSDGFFDIEKKPKK